MIKINVAEIKKRLVGEKTLAYELSPAELEITPEELVVDGTVNLEGTMSNAGDVLLLQAVMTAKVQRTCGRCLKNFTGVARAEVVEKFYPASAEHIEMMLLSTIRTLLI